MEISAITYVPPWFSIVDGKPLALAFDWITGSIYVASAGGFIWACNGRQNSPFTCAVVHEEDGRIQGLALDPIEG